jgi:acyl-CoA synthetase (NDP forming)
MFGLGGVFAEVLEDATFRVVPLKPRDAREMITEIRGYPLLKGARGQQEYAIDALVELIMTLSAMMAERPEIEEMDLNPVRVFANGLTALDARILVRRGEA